ncbi:hypothetical protein C8Q70DRAFT_311575 [Cubamyces menziesii]|nr:hypothetical protein C8Q70DRAFT_311575 [Cubamyces menziesii]
MTPPNRRSRWSPLIFGLHLCCTLNSTAANRGSTMMMESKSLYSTPPKILPASRPYRSYDSSYFWATRPSLPTVLPPRVLGITARHPRSGSCHRETAPQHCLPHRTRAREVIVWSLH